MELRFLSNINATERPQDIDSIFMKSVLIFTLYPPYANFALNCLTGYFKRFERKIKVDD